jgi:thiol-disulfide isomerase/thioredoxin
MKIYYIFVFFIVCAVLGSCKSDQYNYFTIDIKVPPTEYDSLSYYLSRNGLSAYGSWEFKKEYFDSTGNMHLSIETEEINWLFFTFSPNTYKGNAYKNLNRAFLLAQPGKHYSLVFDSTYKWLFKISGDYDVAQNLYNVFNHTHGSLMRTWRTNSDTLPEVLLKHLEDSIKLSIQPFKELFQNGKIDSTFYFTAYNHIKYTQADALLDYIPTRIWLSENPKQAKRKKDATTLNLTEEEVELLEKNVFDRYPISKREAGILPGLGFYIDKYLKYKVKADSLKIHKEGTFLAKLDLANLAQNYLEDDLAELYFAHQFGSAPMNPGPDSLATFLFKEFKKCYPDSHFMPGVMRKIEGLTNFYSAFYPGLYTKNVDQESSLKASQLFLSPKIKIIHENDCITSLDSLLLQFRGKNLFVDFWASWCPPCRYEFRFADSLHSYLESHNIEMLYISTDEDETKWKNVLSNYELTGYHFRASNHELRDELREIVDFVPTYMIIDSTGKILNYDAEMPHTKSVLYNQIKETLKIQE